jgi:hypothetical protein
VVAQIILVAHAPQRGGLRLGPQIGKIILACGEQPRQIGPHRRGQRGLAEKLRPWFLSGAGDQPVGAKMFLVEKGRGAQPGIGIGFITAVAGQIDAKIGEQLFRGETIGKRRFNAHRAAIAKDGAAPVSKLVALGMAAEIVVIVDDQYLAIGAERLAVEIGGRQPGNAAPDDHQIIMFAAVIGRHGAVKFAITRLVGHFERAGILAAQAAAQRRVGRSVGRRGRCPVLRQRRAAMQYGASRRQTADKVTPCDRPVQPQRRVRPFRHGNSPHCPGRVDGATSSFQTCRCTARRLSHPAPGASGDAAWR